MVLCLWAERISSRPECLSEQCRVTQIDEHQPPSREPSDWTLFESFAAFSPTCSPVIKLTISFKGHFEFNMVNTHSEAYSEAGLHDLEE